jgi:hypothetical protein
MHLRTIDVGGAGNCFFLSVSFGLYGDEKHHAAVRASVAQFIRKQAEAAQPNDRAVLLKRAADVSRDGFWPGEDVIVATAQCLQRPLHVYAAVGVSPLVYLPLSAPAKDVLPLKIAFMEPGHYNAVVSTLSTSAMSHPVHIAFHDGLQGGVGHYEVLPTDHSSPAPTHSDVSSPPSAHTDDVSARIPFPVGNLPQQRHTLGASTQSVNCHTPTERCAQQQQQD